MSRSPAAPSKSTALMSPPRCARRRCVRTDITPPIAHSIGCRAGTSPLDMLDDEALTTMQREQELIDRSAEEGARVVALGLLSDADQAARALELQDDDEALHDFRVALRRLRSVLRAFRPWLAGTVRRKHEKRLKRLGRGTNAARDAEVQLAWLSSEREALASG